MTKIYTVRAERWERGWELYIEGVGVTQCSTLTDASRMACDYLATELGGEPEDYAVTVTPDTPGGGSEGSPRGHGSDEPV